MLRTEGFSDHFSATAQDYARYRPRYPSALFDWLASLAGRREIAWDCATGNGQAAVELAARFNRVIATDASAAQVANAPRDPRVLYVVALAEEQALSSRSADLLTIAQALHWFDLDRFYAEVRRVLAPGGVVAAWSYRLASVDPSVDAVITRLYSEIVGPYWPPERAFVAGGYAALAFPFAEIPAPWFAMEERWDLSRLIGYFGTWSAAQRYRAATGRDPIELIRGDLERAWGAAAARTVRWPLSLRVGRLETA